jgi:hypothetical protein
MRPFIAIKAIAERTASMSLEMLEMRNHPIIGRLMRPNSTAALAAAFHAARGKVERLGEGDDNPSLAV